MTFDDRFLLLSKCGLWNNTVQIPYISKIINAGEMELSTSQKP
jgi:hypothetical protein